MGFVSYGMDYFDASNMLSVYKSGGRHNWDNDEYDGLLAKGAAESRTSKRQEIYTQAQVLLTQQAPAAVHLPPALRLLLRAVHQGCGAEKNKDGYDGIQWPGFCATSQSLQDLYVADNVNSWPRQQQTGII